MRKKNQFDGENTNKKQWQQHSTPEVRYLILDQNQHYIFHIATQIFFVSHSGHHNDPQQEQMRY